MPKEIKVERIKIYGNNLVDKIISIPCLDSSTTQKYQIWYQFSIIILRRLSDLERH